MFRGWIPFLDEPVNLTFEVSDVVFALRACGVTKDLECGRRVHCSSLIQGFCGIDISNSLVRMYGRCGSVANALVIFERMPSHSTVSWNALILAYVENGQAGLALEIFFSRMEEEWCSSSTYVAVLMACSSLLEEKEDDWHKTTCLEAAKSVHLQATQKFEGKLSQVIFVANALMETYAKCGSMADAWEVFRGMDSRDVVSWTTVMRGYVRNGEAQVALELFQRMKACKCELDSRAYVVVLSACASLADREEGAQVGGKTVKLKILEKGMEIHSQLETRNRVKKMEGFGGDLLDSRNQEQVFLSGSLVDMYCRCGALVDAQRVFDRTSHGQRNVVLWTALIQGYAENGENEVALRLFSSMDGVRSSRTFLAALTACAGLGAKEQGRLVSGKVVKLSSLENGMEVHARAVEAGVSSDLFVANTLVDMYSKCGSVLDARRCFDRLVSHSIVSWTALILGCAENGENELALDLFRRVSCRANSLTYAAALTACANMGALQSGRKIHAEAEALGFNTAELSLANSLIHEQKGSSDLELAHIGIQQQRSNTRACSHAGLVTKAGDYFQGMRVKPEIQHYHCMIDALGRANLLDEAVELAERRMPWQATAVTWTTILSSCRKWKNVAVAKLAFKAVMRLDRNEGAAYVLMASMFESLELWQEQRSVLAMASSSQNFEGNRTKVIKNRRA
ncbi:pentatricopeptide repeat-containing protein At5g16860-like [Selaginella moellendorffii]|uniref:pentatricopeptide repeat-containing protein At5g16860-like n=1 Tax=Selaginella moellendorffii TaxID=88036 RepID=UPI000D1CA620|nr:pentatricopeptide repeat-containing protein At5g16860-like [Selaginella moellendorffii]|eukprot:XP_024519904.1 pentatricopeptide repeat-containing protein At5g16860-like [Selaginella moellendorffii]